MTRPSSAWRRSTARLAVAAALGGGAGAVGAASLDEASFGDLSGDRLAPTVWLLDGTTVGPNGQSGQNVLSGSTGRAAAVDRDYLSIVVPEGYVWSELRVGQQTTTGGAGGAFIGLAAGAFMPVAADAPSAQGLLGWRHYGLADRGTDILDDMAVPAFGSSGFAPPLGAGTYTVWIQELALGSYGYRFNFVLLPVPQPAAAVLGAAGLLVLAGLLPPRLRRRAGAPAIAPTPSTGRSAGT